MVTRAKLTDQRSEHHHRVLSIPVGDLDRNFAPLLAGTIASGLTHALDGCVVCAFTHEHQEAGCVKLRGGAEPALAGRKPKSTSQFCFAYATLASHVDSAIRNDWKRFEMQKTAGMLGGTMLPAGAMAS